MDRGLAPTLKLLLPLSYHSPAMGDRSSLLSGSGIYAAMLQALPTRAILMASEYSLVDVLERM